MALSAGTAAATTGLALRIKDAMQAQPRLAIPAVVPGEPAALAVAREAQAQFAYAIALAVVAEIVANGEAFVTTSKGQLQQAGGVDTTAPAAERSLPLR